ncbi:hypothetical protein T06_11390 [Trichinella sp. T6]|nr:hypothetical protein T06_12754 [Trichinella sp. T6]KRX70043.1 hypothetical protein T06_11390 [Trichinella sp. T6]
MSNTFCGLSSPTGVAAGEALSLQPQGCPSSTDASTAAPFPPVLLQLPFASLLWQLLPLGYRRLAAGLPSQRLL